jgi:hypothetical protein
MASEKKIAANRRNAAKSKGPRSAAGKKNARRNAQTHGLSSLIERKAIRKEIEALARTLADGDDSEIVFDYARRAAEAEFDLGRARRAKLALVDRVAHFGSLERPRFFATDVQEVRWAIKMEKWLTNGRGRRPNRPVAEDLLLAMPDKGPERSLEAMRRVLPELAKLGRYEQRAASRRNQAIRKIAKLKQDRG